MTATLPPGPAAIEKAAADSRVIRDHMIATDPLQASVAHLAAELANWMREYTDPAVAIEWGRGLLVAGCQGAGIAAGMRRAGHNVPDAFFLNLLGWAGLALHGRRVMTVRTRRPSGKPAFGDPRLPARFWAKVVVTESGCWEWQASLTAGGYGQFYPKKSLPRRAHRVAYEALVGPIPEGLQLDHLCRTRRCCNPSHVEPVTSRENTMRGQNFAARHAAATHCPANHPYDGDNLRVRPTGRRACRECERQRVRAARARKAQEAAA